MTLSITHLSQDLVALTRSVGSDAFYPNLHQLFSQHFEYDELLILHMSRTTSVKLNYRFGKDGVENRLQGEDSWKYLTRLYVLDPFYRLYADKNQFGFFTLDQIAPEEFESIYNSYFNYLNLSDEIGHLIDLGDGTCLHIDMSLFGSEKKFSEASLTLLTELHGALSDLITEHHTKLGNVTEMDTSLVEHVLANFGKDLLTKKEYQACQLLLQGYSTKNIADLMNIGYETVKMHKKNIYSKTYMSSQAELLALFIDILQQEDLDPELDLLQQYVNSF